jgi:hypothetical protein
VRLRRDHVKYLALIDAIALLHQQQRPVHTLEVNGAGVEYVEVTRDDIALANRLAHAVLGRSLDELPPQTRRVLSALDAWISDQATVQGIGRADVRFTRRTVRGHLGLSDTQLRVHLDRLVQLDYVAVHGGKMGQRFAYELLFDGDADAPGPQVMGLSEGSAPERVPTSRGETATSRGKSPTSRGSTPNLAGRLRPDSGGVAAPSRGSETTRTASNGAAHASLATALPETERSGIPRPRRRRNGSDDGLTAH